jgi:hypothetical protein
MYQMISNAAAAMAIRFSSRAEFCILIAKKDGRHLTMPAVVIRLAKKSG